MLYAASVVWGMCGEFTLYTEVGLVLAQSVVWGMCGELHAEVGLVLAKL